MHVDVAPRIGRYSRRAPGVHRSPRSAPVVREPRAHRSTRTVARSRDALTRVRARARVPCASRRGRRTHRRTAAAPDRSPRAAGRARRPRVIPLPRAPCRWWSPHRTPRRPAPTRRRRHGAGCRPAPQRRRPSAAASTRRPSAPHGRRRRASPTRSLARDRPPHRRARASGSGGCERWRSRRRRSPTPSPGERDPGAVQPRGVHAQPGHQLRAGRGARAAARRSCSSSTATMQTLEMELLARHLRGAPRAAHACSTAARTCAAHAQITDLMDIDPTTHAPPVLLFTWGSLSFTCVLARATQRFIMFLPDGTPVRARLQVTFNEFRNVDLEAKEIKRETADYSKLPRRPAGRDADVDRRRGLRRPALWRPIALRNAHRRPARARRRARSSSFPPLPYRDPDTGEVYRRAMTNPPLRTRVPPAARRRAGPGGAARARSTRLALPDRRSRAPDRVELTLANEHLRWLDHPLLDARPRARRWRSATRPTRSSSCSSARSSRTTRRSRAAACRRSPSSRRTGASACRQGTKARWFAIPIPTSATCRSPTSPVVAHRRARARAGPAARPGRRRALGHPRRRRAGGGRTDRRRRAAARAQAAARERLRLPERIARENGWELLDRPRRSARRRAAALLVAARPPRADVDAALRPLADRLHAADHDVGQIVSVTAFVWVAADQDELRGDGRLGLGPDVSSTIDVRPGVRSPTSARAVRHDRSSEPLTPLDRAAQDPRRAAPASSTSASPARAAASATPASSPGAVLSSRAWASSSAACTASRRRPTRSTAAATARRSRCARRSGSARSRWPSRARSRVTLSAPFCGRPAASRLLDVAARSSNAVARAAARRRRARRRDRQHRLDGAGPRAGAAPRGCPASSRGRASRCPTAGSRPRHVLHAAGRRRGARRVRPRRRARRTSSARCGTGPTTRPPAPRPTRVTSGSSRRPQGHEIELDDSAQSITITTLDGQKVDARRRTRSSSTPAGASKLELEHRGTVSSTRDDDDDARGDVDSSCRRTTINVEAQARRQAQLGGARARSRAAIVKIN